MTRSLSLGARYLDAFSSDYYYAKEKFLELSRHCSLIEDLQSFPLDEAKDESLSTEVVWIGPKSAKNLLILISATHGVEGFVGAAIQADFMRRIQEGYTLPEDIAVVMIFALNPYGFAHCRRCDEMGVDLNRNFIDFTQPLPVNEKYDLLKEAIYCDDAVQRQQMLESFRQQWGQSTYEIAVSGGQYNDSYGPFYGGNAPSHGNKVIDQLIARYQLEQRQLAVIDIHSGLGSYAYGELINDHQPESSGYQIAKQWYGASVTSPASGDSSSVPKLGLLDYRWHDLMHEYGCFITLEFGSYSTQALFDVIIENHRSWKQGDQQVIVNSMNAMKEHFCPDDNYWRELVLVKARQVIQQAIEGVCNE